MSLTSLFVRRPVMTTLIMIGILVFGIVSYRKLPVSDLPTVDFPSINVDASLPRGQPGNDGRYGSHAAGKSILRHRGHRLGRVTHARPDRREVVGVDDRLRPSARGPARPRRRSALAVTRSSGSGTSERNGSSGPALRGTQRAPTRSGPRAPGRVLERLALEQPGEQQVALLEAQQLLVELDIVGAGQQAAGLELDERRGDEQELGRDLEVEPCPGARARRGTRRRSCASETSQRSTSCLRIRCSSRSNGPS